MKVLFTFIFIFYSSLLYSQQLSISGWVTDNKLIPLTGANVILLGSADSLPLKGVVTDSAGHFVLEKVNSGRYILKITFISYSDYHKNIELSSSSLNLGGIKLEPGSKALNEAIVVGSVLPSKMIGDTTQFNADAFKTNKDATSEDLVTKMPGITMQDGKVQAQGEDVKRVTVDGRPFFGDDPNAVLKNLPAEVIDKIQVFDRRSDQSQFTGIDDGNYTKTINIVTKQQFRNGTFGKVYGGYGTEDRFKAGFNLNFFKDKRRITLLANSNNTNEQNFAQEDLLGVSSTNSGGNRGQGMRGWGGRGGSGGRGGQGGQGNDANNFLVDQKNGISTTHSFGINYADKWSNVEFTGSYFFNYSENKTESNLLRTYVTQEDAGYEYSENSKSNSKNINHRVNLKFDWKIDSMNSILFQPRFSAQLNDGSSLLLGQNKLPQTIVSTTLNDYNSNLTGLNFLAPVLYRHSFEKKGRTLSLNLSPGYNENKGYSYLRSFTDYYDYTLSVDTINQLANLNSSGKVFTGNLSYTEPITSKSQLLFSYTNNDNISNSEKETFNYTPSEENYNSFDTSLSNNFTSTYIANSFGTTYQYQAAKWSLNAGLTYQYASLNGDQQFPYSDNVKRSFNSLLPGALFMYRFTNQKNLRAVYRSNNTAPTISQLQNVVNNSNPLQLTTGNPNLRQDWQNNFFARYSSVNIAKSISFFGMAGFTYTADYIANSVLYAVNDTVTSDGIALGAGSQLTRPVNLDGFYNFRTFANYSFPISQIKCNLNLNIGGTFSHTPGLISNNVNYANSTMANTGFALTSNISEKFDFSVSSSVSYNNISNTLQSELNSSYVNYNSKIKFQVMPYKGLVLQTDVTHQFYNGLSAGYDDSYYLWNAGVGYKFLKSNVAELRLTVYDLLDQNKSITRNTTETYYEDIESNVLQRYFLLTFTYNLKFFKESARN